MWWKNLDCLDALHWEGTMAGAARRLGIDKATVSRRMAQLEQAAPSPLFERRCGAFELTPYGVRALSAYREHERSRSRLLAELEATDPDIQGTVRLTAPRFAMCLLVTPALRRFVAKHPKVLLQVDGTHRLLDLARDEADVAVRNICPTHGSVSVRKVGRLGLAAYASDRYLAERGELRCVDDLRGHDVLTYGKGQFSGAGFEAFSAAARHARVFYCEDDALALRDAARADLGIAVLPHIVGDDVPELHRVRAVGESVVDLWVVTRDEQRRTRRIRAVVDFLADLVRAEQHRLYSPG